MRAEAALVWALVARPNVLVGIPATSAGVIAIEELIAAGVSVEATMILAAAVRRGRRGICAWDRAADRVGRPACGLLGRRLGAVPDRRGEHQLHADVAADPARLRRSEHHRAQLEGEFRRFMPDQSPACAARLDAFFGQWFDTAFPPGGGVNRLQLTGPGACRTRVLRRERRLHRASGRRRDGRTERERGHRQRWARRRRRPGAARCGVVAHHRWPERA